MRTIAALLLLALVSFPLAACGDDDDSGGADGSGGGGGDAASFCDDARDLDERFAGIGEDFDPESLAEVRNTLADLDAPAEIEDDFETLVDGFDVLIEALEDIDINDPEALQELGGLAEEFEESEAAADRIGTFLEEECGIESD